MMKSKTGLIAVLDTPDGQFEIKNYPLPEPAPGTILLKQELSGVCGTDLHMYHGRLPGIQYPIVLGHEFVGHIAALGEGVEKDFLGNEVKEGDLVAVNPGVSCGKCFFCSVSKTSNTCPNGFCYGFFSDGDKYCHFTGGFGEYIYLHKPGTAFFKTDLPAETAVLIEPFTVALNCISRSNIKHGDTVVVQGTGTIGLLMQAAAHLTGAAKVINVGGPKERFELAKEFGADVTISIDEVPDPEERLKMIRAETTGGYGADVVIECAGNPHAFQEGLNMVRRSGTFVEAGNFTDTGSIDINPFRQICNKNINLHGSWGAETEHFVRGLSILKKGEFPYAKLVTHKIPLRRLNEIIELPEKGYVLDGKIAMKVAVQ